MDLAERPAVALVTLGCAKNEADSARLTTILADRFALVEDPGAADAVVVNTCGFIEAAVEESLAAVIEAAGLPGRPVVAAVGCLVDRYRGELDRALPEADVVVGLGELTRLGDLLEVALERRRGAAGPHGWAAPPARRAPSARAAPADDLWAVRSTVSGPSAYLTVSDGCDRRCTYCTIPSIRGRYRSRPITHVLAEAEEMVAAGVHEIVLVGQDVSVYGRDLPAVRGARPDLASLLASLAGRVGEEAWIRLLYLQPDGITDDLLAAYGRHRNAVPYLDVPIQHVDARLLAAMGRSGDARSFAGLASRIRKALPDAFLRTTVICGFPGETAEAFGRLERFVSEGHFDYVGVFSYSREEGTPAAALDHRVRRDTRERRAARLRLAAEDAFSRRAETLVGRTLQVLALGGSDDARWQWMGRFAGQAPEVDGVVYWSGPAAYPWTRVQVEQVLGYDLAGVAQT